VNERAPRNAKLVSALSVAFSPRSHLLSDFHAPAKWRVLGPVSNVAEFYEAFGVTSAQRMWKEERERAAVW
jgi:putative endopeptidase